MGVGGGWGQELRGGSPGAGLDRTGMEENTEGEANTLLLATQNFPRQKDNVNNG